VVVNKMRRLEVENSYSTEDLREEIRNSKEG